MAREHPGEVHITAQAGRARAGLLETAHGTIETPVFMPVGTQASVKALSADLERLGPRVILGNTYDLALRPGAERIEALGGLKFMAWPRAILTGSEASRSSASAIAGPSTTDGVTFQSHLDGSAQRLTPERAMAIQAALGTAWCAALFE